MKSSKIDVESLTTEAELFDTIDASCISGPVALCLRGKIVAYLVSKDDFRELKKGLGASDERVVDILTKGWIAAVLDDESLSAQAKVELVNEMGDLDTFRLSRSGG